MDTLTEQQRSERMKRIRGRDSKPELLVRRLVHGMGYRYRLHCRDLPGKPDLVFRPKRKVIFVHGCFWHRHDDTNCRLARLPKSRLDFWYPKLEQNKQRDQRNSKLLVKMGWSSLVIWECQVKDEDWLEREIKEYLN
ncbi:very short patch repair endonuclease [Ruegeria meonggei]|uniref:very short patch repair endonuclease n=1 Tax=Ruegeria meonggei TaxID=1446476 RepID=UPI000A269032|nr:DNA mismatch endonuclease Vsr [Ruegeria meonggei]